MYKIWCKLTFIFSVIKGSSEPLQEHYNRQSKTLKKLRQEHAEILASFKILEEKTMQLEAIISFELSE